MEDAGERAPVTVEGSYSSGYTSLRRVENRDCSSAYPRERSDDTKGFHCSGL